MTKSKLVVCGLALAAMAAGCSKEQSETLTVVYSNDLKGVIRSCGCPVNDFGGLGRRATFVDITRDSTKNFLLIDAGDFFGAELNYGNEKADVTMKSMAFMGYDAVVLGEKDMGFGVDYIVKRSREVGLPVLVANLFDAAGDSLLFPPSWTVEYPSGLVAGLIGVMGNQLKLPPQVKKGSIRIGDPVQAIRREIKALGDQVDLVVVVAHLTRREAQTIAQEVPEVDLVVFGHEGRPMRTVRRFGNAFVLQVADEGRYMGIAFAVLDGEGGIRKLDSYFPPMSKEYEDHEAIGKLFRAYDMNVAAKEKSTLSGAVVEARAGLKKPFAGSAACGECHEAEHAVWEESKHAHAFEILVGESREYDRDCIPCHTTGFFKRGGFEHLAVTPDLIDIGCESCHGNGHDHIQDPDTATDGDARAACGHCHTPEQDADFDFGPHWERIQH
jgi:2',3'-cyclic-nucleotide 2'-phosphodiesterase (5'-nucleotidase family)